MMLAPRFLLGVLLSCGAPAGAAEFAEVQAILVHSCIDCHGAGKAKGGLRLDTPENLMKGGKHGAAVVPGRPGDSPLYTRVILPGDDSDVMPAKGDHLSQQQTDAIMAWITAGAHTDGAITTGADPTVKPPSTPIKPAGPVPEVAGPMIAAGGKVNDAPSAPVKLDLPDTDLDLLAKTIKPPTNAQLASVTAAGIWFRTLSKNGSLLECDCRQASTPPGKALELLSGLASSIVWLDLSGTALSDDDLARLRSFRHLQRLHLERTAIDDKGLSQLSGLDELVYLNLYGTGISDAGLASLVKLIHLNELYLRGTKATLAGAGVVKHAIPGLTVVFDEELPSPASPEDAHRKPGKGKKAN